jgi:hypothetical protein
MDPQPTGVYVMKLRQALLALAFVLGASVIYAHELFIKLDTYFLEAGSEVRVPILNGTFTRSESSVTADRVADIVIAGPGETQRPGSEGWDASTDTSYLTIQLGTPGTYVLGVSTRSRLIELDAETFNAYLEGEGIPDVLEARRKAGRLDRDAVERYSKHVKAVYQVGETRSGGWDRALGFPAELVPLANPYELAVGDEIGLRSLVHGKPVANQLVIAGGDGNGEAIEEREARTDEDGVVRFVVDRPGKWYVKFIHMVESGEEGVDYESNWATISFELR